MNTLLHLIDKFHPIDKIYLYAKDTDEEKYQYLINKREQDIMRSEKFKAIVKELFIRFRKLNISIVFLLFL